VRDLELGEALHEGVVLAVGHRRRVALVVLVAQLDDAPRELLDLVTSRGEVVGGLGGHDLVALDAEGRLVAHGTGTGTALAVRSMVHWPSTRVPT
jgi:hypothetical protein